MFETILLNTLPVFMVVAVGCVARLAKIINDETETNLMRLVLNVLYPCFVLSKVPGNKSLQSPLIVVTTIAIGAGLIFAAFIICWLVGKAMKIQVSEGLNTFVVASGIQNYGFIPIPLIQSLFPKECDEILGVLFVHSLGVEIALWTVAVIIISGSTAGAWKRLLNGPTIAIGIGLFLNFTGWHTGIPNVARDAIDMVGVCAIPIALILVGASLWGVLESEKWKFDLRVMITAPILRFAVLPVMFLLTACAMAFSPELQTVLLVQATMPTAVTPILLARHFGGHPRVAVQVCLTTSLLSLALTPALLTLAFWLLGVDFVEPASTISAQR